MCIAMGAFHCMAVLKWWLEGPMWQGVLACYAIIAAFLMSTGLVTWGCCEVLRMITDIDTSRLGMIESSEDYYAEVSKLWKCEGAGVFCCAPMEINALREQSSLA